MGNLTSQLIRTCNACGIEKPLSAFLQLSDTSSTIYGKICSTCRNMGKTGKTTPTTTDEERSTEPSGIGIRGKEKLYRDAKHEENIRTLKEFNYKKEDKKQDDVEKLTSKLNLKETSEKKLREFYIASKQPAMSPDQKKMGGQQKFENQQKLQKIFNTRVAAEHHKTTLHAKAEEDIKTIKDIEQDTQRKTSTDFNNLFHAIEPGKIEMQGELRRFFTWLGNSAPIVKTLSQGKGSTGTKNNPSTENRKDTVEEVSHRHRN